MLAAPHADDGLEDLGDLGVAADEVPATGPSSAAPRAANGLKDTAKLIELDRLHEMMMEARLDRAPAVALHPPAR